MTNTELARLARLRTKIRDIREIQVHRLLRRESTIRVEDVDAFNYSEGQFLLRLIDDYMRSST